MWPLLYSHQENNHVVKDSYNKLHRVFGVKKNRIKILKKRNYFAVHINVGLTWFELFLAILDQQCTVFHNVRGGLRMERTFFAILVMCFFASCGGSSGSGSSATSGVTVGYEGDAAFSGLTASDYTGVK